MKIDIKFNPVRGIMIDVSNDAIYNAVIAGAGIVASICVTVIICFGIAHR